MREMRRNSKGVGERRRHCSVSVANKFYALDATYIAGIITLAFRVVLVPLLIQKGDAAQQAHLGIIIDDHKG